MKFLTPSWVELSLKSALPFSSRWNSLYFGYPVKRVRWLLPNLWNLFGLGKNSIVPKLNSGCYVELFYVNLLFTKFMNEIGKYFFFREMKVELNCSSVSFFRFEIFFGNCWNLEETFEGCSAIIQDTHFYFFF